jgi:hypothetical protein
MEDGGGTLNQHIGKTEHDSSRDFGGGRLIDTPKKGHDDNCKWGFAPFGENAMQDIQKEGTEQVVVFGEESNSSQFLPSAIEQQFNVASKTMVTPFMNRLQKMASDTVTKSQRTIQDFGEKLFVKDDDKVHSTPSPFKTPTDPQLMSTKIVQLVNAAFYELGAKYHMIDPDLSSKIHMLFIDKGYSEWQALNWKLHNPQETTRLNEAIFFSTPSNDPKRPVSRPTYMKL